MSPVALGLRAMASAAAAIALLAERAERGRDAQGKPAAMIDHDDLVARLGRVRRLRIEETRRPSSP
jgi:hypothetical protein